MKKRIHLENFSNFQVVSPPSKRQHNRYNRQWRRSAGVATAKMYEFMDDMQLFKAMQKDTEVQHSYRPHSFIQRHIGSSLHTQQS